MKALPAILNEALDPSMSLFLYWKLKTGIKICNIVICLRTKCCQNLFFRVFLLYNVKCPPPPPSPLPIHSYLTPNFIEIFGHPKYVLRRSEPSASTLAIEGPTHE